MLSEENLDHPAMMMMMQRSPAVSVGSPKNEFLFKILVIGELGTGKTSYIKRYVHQFFSQHYRATIGVDFALKVLTWDAQTVIRLQLWDIAGQERFGNMTRVYFKEAVGALIVFDLTRSDTLNAVEKWKNDLDSKVLLPDGRPVPCVLIGSKCDQMSQGVDAIFRDRQLMDSFCQEKGFIGWFFTSAKENINIDDSARFLVHKIVENDRWATRQLANASRDSTIQLHASRPWATDTPDASGNAASNLSKKCSC